ncbi:uncharacterized protein LOC124434810 isoform X2 [Xenia sp. Carnegie-2017]|uniref:uncharacterized protein LOC124434810 isoform X2 n=1 Tax=Xenia sp. Carnegie-2017 TaxID=2897299 RepID=UPI001F033F32|nr:uncharacterized protein LOC124434810 isoform X2 [Xenia sp. Carnegie-2017]
MDALRQWNGSLLQIQIKCRGRFNKEERHCFLIKLQSLLPLEPETTSTTSPTSSSNHTLQPHEEREEGSSQAIAIAVSVSLATIVLVLVLFYFVWYRKHISSKTEREVLDSHELANQRAGNLLETEPTGVEGNIFMTLTSQGEEETYTYVNDEEENKTQSRMYEQPAGDSYNKHNIKTTIFERPLTHQTANKDNYTPLMKNRTSRDSNSHYYQRLEKESIQINGNNSMLSLSHGNEQPNQSVEPECISDYVIPNDAGPPTHQTANKDNYTPLIKKRTSRDTNSHYYQRLQKESIQMNGNNSMLSLSHGNEQPNQSVEPECISDYVIPNDAGTSVHIKKQPKPENRTSYTGEYAIPNEIEHTTIARNNNTNNTVRKVANSNDEDPFQFVESNVYGYESLMKHRRSSDHYYQHLQ